MVVRDPALVVVFSINDSNGNGLGAGEGLNDVDSLLSLLSGAGALGLREEGLDPGLVDEVEGTSESSGEEEVEEDAECIVSLRREHGKRNIHLGVKKAGRSLNDGGRAIVDQDLVEGTGRVRDKGLELDANLLRLHILSEREGKLLLLAGGDLNVVLNGRQVANDADILGAVLRKLLKGVERARDESDLDRVGVLIGDLNDSLGRTTVDELHAENV